MTEVVCICQISYVTFGQRKLGPVCFIFSMTTPQPGLQWNPRMSLCHYICTCIRQIQKKKLLKNTKNPFLKNTIKIWHNASVYLGMTKRLSQFTPIFGNDDFHPGRADLGFKLWSSKGLVKISDLYDGKEFMSFKDLAFKYGIPIKHFF